MPNQKNLERLNKLLEAFDNGAVQPEELIKAIDAVMAIIDQNGRTLVDKIVETRKVSETGITGLKGELAKTRENLQAVINQVKNNSDTSVVEVRNGLLREIKRVEALIPVLPPETDLSEVFAEIESQKAQLANLSFSIVGENVRNSLEALQGDDRLDKSAIRGLDELVEELKSKKETPTVAGVRLLRYLSDVAIEGIENGETLVWNSTTSKFEPGAGGGGSSTFLDLTDTPATYSGQAGKVAAVNGDEDGIEFIDASGVGTVTSVAVSGSDGIEVDSGSPITAAGTIALGLNKTNTLTFLNVEDGADVTDTANVTSAGALMDSEVTNLAAVKAFDPTDYATSAQGALADTASQPGHTHVASDVTDFDTEVSNNTDVAANTTARHDAVTLSGTPNYITLVGQDIVRALVNLASHVTGILPLANGGTGSALTDPNADRIGFWDDSAGIFTWLTASTGLTISGTSMTVRTTSASQTGIVELATDAETVTGTDTTRATTPANITAKMAAPGTIGGTTPGAITGTTITANTHVNLNAQTASRVAILDASKNITSADTATYPSLTELAYVKGLTSAAQTQINTKVGYTTTTTTSSATPTPTGDAQRNELIVTALAENATIAAPTGTPAAGNMLKVIITATGSTRTVGYNAALTAGNVTRTTSVPAGETLMQVYQYENSAWVAHYDNLN